MLCHLFVWTIVYVLLSFGVLRTRATDMIYSIDSNLDVAVMAKLSLSLFFHHILRVGVHRTSFATTIVRLHQVNSVFGEWPFYRSLMCRYTFDTFCASRQSAISTHLSCRDTTISEDCEIESRCDDADESTDYVHIDSAHLHYYYGIMIVK